jgi:catechol 2,3-dioxygenase-like lactoylglutathione lyase family enzyme
VIHHLALRVRDLRAASAFYRDLLGLRERRRLRRHGRLRAVWLEAGGVVLMLERTLRGRGARRGSGHVLVLAARELLASERRLRAARVRIDDRTTHTLYFRDPDGHRVGLSDFRFAKARLRRARRPSR